MRPSESEININRSQSIHQEQRSARNDRVLKSVLATFIAALGPLSFEYSLTYTSSAVLDLEVSGEIPSLRLTKEQASWFSSLITLGAMFGSIIGGWAIDYFGRKSTIMMCSLPFELGWFLIAFAKNHEMLYAGRVISGVACGMITVAVPVRINKY